MHFVNPREQRLVYSIFRGLTKTHCHPQRGHYLYFIPNKRRTVLILFRFILSSKDKYTNNAMIMLFAHALIERHRATLRT